MQVDFNFDPVAKTLIGRCGYWALLGDFRWRSVLTLTIHEYSNLSSAQPGQGALSTVPKHSYAFC